MAEQKKQRADGQMSGLAGEFFVAAELLKRGIQTSVTFGTAKAIDLFAYRADTEKTLTVQVKSLRAENYFPINRKKVVRSCVYVFALLNRPGVAVRYFIVPGSDLIDHPEKFGKGYSYTKMPGILPRDLLEYENNWELFGCTE